MHVDPINLYEYEARAQQVLPHDYWDFIAGGSKDELTTRRNRTADQIGGALIEGTALIGPVPLARSGDVSPAERDGDDDDGDSEHEPAEFGHPRPHDGDHDQRHQQGGRDPDCP